MPSHYADYDTDMIEVKKKRVISSKLETYIYLYMCVCIV